MAETICAAARGRGDLRHRQAILLPCAGRAAGTGAGSAPVFSCRSALAINGRKRVVLAFREDAGEYRLKPVVEALDEHAGADAAEQLRTRGVDARAAVLHLLRLRARHAALPACGSSGTRRTRSRRTRIWRLCGSGTAKTVRCCALFEQPGQTLSVSEIRDRLGKGAGQTLDALAGEGILVYHSNTAQKTGDKTEKMLRLDMEASEAMSHIAPQSGADGRGVAAVGRRCDEPEGNRLHDRRERRRAARHDEKGHPPRGIRGSAARTGLFRGAARRGSGAFGGAAAGV